jgi:hypothetical protein
MKIFLQVFLQVSFFILIFLLNLWAVKEVLRFKRKKYAFKYGNIFEVKSKTNRKGVALVLVLDTIAIAILILILIIN